MKKLLIILLLFVSYNCISQENISIRVNSGFVSEYENVDGVYFSFDIGIPIIKSLELAPTFSYYMVSSNINEHTYLDDFSVLPRENLNGFQYNDTSGIFDLILIFKPLELFSISNPKHDIGFGAGLIGIGYFTQLRSRIDDNGVTVAFSYYQGTHINYFHGKVFYSYHFTDNLFAGVIAGVNASDLPYFGFQFGISLEKKKELD